MMAEAKPAEVEAAVSDEGTQDESPTETAADADAAALPDPVAEVDVATPPSSATDLTHVVLRPFIGAGIERVIGEVVDASAWRMAQVLVDGRRLRPFERNDPTPVSDGDRFFIDDDALLAYIEASIEAEVAEPDYSEEN